VSKLITHRIPNDIPCHHILSFVKQLVQSGAESLEVDVFSFGENRLVVCTNINIRESFDSEEELVYLEDLFAWVRDWNIPIQLILNLRNAFLEQRVKRMVDQWDLKKQVNYCGIVDPAALTPWDRPYIHYNIENCLPNVYRLGPIKRTHFDVLHYFCTKYRVTTVRLHRSLFTQEILEWTEALDLKLSIYGIKKTKEAKQLREAGVDFVATSDSKKYRQLIVNH